VVIEPLFFSEIIKKIEIFYKTGEVNVNQIIITMIYWTIFILFNIILLYIYRYYITDILSINNFRRVFIKYAKKVFNMHY
jgi:hypothetical protein